MSHSTNSGFKVRALGEDGFPPCAITWSGREGEWRLAFVTPRPSPATGVAHVLTAASVSVLPEWRPLSVP